MHLHYADAVIKLHNIEETKIKPFCLRLNKSMSVGVEVNTLVIKGLFRPGSYYVAIHNLFSSPVISLQKSGLTKNALNNITSP